MIIPDIVIKDNEHLKDLHMTGALNNSLIEVPSFMEDGDPILVNLSDKAHFADTDASNFLEYIEKNYLDKFKKVLIELSLEFYIKKQKTPKSSPGFPIITKTRNYRLDSWLNSYAAKSPIKNRKSVGGYVFSLTLTEAKKAITKIVDELITFDGWADAISDVLLSHIDLNVYPAFILSRKNFIRKLSCAELFENLLFCTNALGDLKKKRIDNPPLNLIGDADEMLFFSEAHLDTESRYQSSQYRNMYLKVLSIGTVTKYWIPSLHGNIYKIPRLQFRTIASNALDDAIGQAFSSSRKSILTSHWSRIIICTSIGKTLNFPIQIRLLGDLLLGKELSSRAGYRKIAERLSIDVDFNYPLEMCDIVHRQRRKEEELEWYKEYAIVEKNGSMSVEPLAQIDAGVAIKSLPSEWQEALEIYHQAKLTSDGHKSQIILFVKWAIKYKNALSPWDLKAVDFYDPTSFFTGNTVSFFDYLNDDPNAKSKSTKVNKWGLTRSFYGVVANTLKLREKHVVSPFKDLPNVDFTGKRKSRKTPRARISSIVIDKMVEIICDFDENGVPTYAWAKNKSLDALNSDHQRGRTDHFLFDGKYIFCPSRASSLAFLLLLPIRGVQVRWLDQGLFDEEIFDVTSMSFIRNQHQLKRFKSEYNRTQLDVNGAPVSTIRKPKNLILTGESEFSIYINTNKTQLWSPDEKHGYELPWPFTSNPKQIHEKQLNKPYNILFEQYRWLEKYSPNPTPLRFDHLASDKKRVTNARGLLSNLPYIVPVFRDLKETESYKMNNHQMVANPPISKFKIERLFNELSAETEKQLRNNGLDVTLVDEEGVSIFDIHTLRVTGISNLLDLGLPLHIVSEFIAGHASIFMTLGYSKSEAEEIKKRIYEAQKTSSNASSAAENILLGNENRPLFAPNKHASDVDLSNRNIATFAPVEGGVCPLGGKGCAGCLEGMVSNEDSNEFIPVQGGCGNCRFWLTNHDFLLEQTLELNRIMFVMEESARDIQYYNDCAEETEWDIEDATTPEEQKRLNVKFTTILSNIKGIEESLAPLMAAWINRYLAIQQSEKLKEAEEKNPSDKPTLIGDINISTSLKSGTDFQLAHAIVEQAYLLPKGSVPIPENPARNMREFLDTIISNLDTSLLFARIKDKHIANKSALKLADLLNNNFTQDEVELLSDGKLLEISETKLEDFTKGANLLQSIVDKQLAAPKTRNKASTQSALEEIELL